MRILVVEDDPDISMLMCLVLGDAGHEAHPAPDGLAAIAILREEARPQAPGFDLVVLDWAMPRLDGLGLARRIRDDLGLSDLPVLMVTATPERHPAHEAGVDHVLAKPFTADQLEAAVASVAHRRGGHGATG
ncbi:response regulator [Nocardioides acrostichi]|uniref:Response regulator transcription factor n=1 Tax=Nocardioides acrostichi TaxID=2784339 RepID=A0A930UY96_9ACTN|nr:response regulator transcription factor [Nocardioides acrostichi]MBF4161922.1 response regulator transcription factor [Nocardioides acrostichi]